MNNLLCEELKTVLKSRNLKVSGTKEELIDRVSDRKGGDINNLKVSELKQILLSRGETVVGKKSELVERILSKSLCFIGHKNLDLLTVKELKEILSTFEVKTTGKKEELIDRILEFDKITEYAGVIANKKTIDDVKNGFFC